MEKTQIRFLVIYAFICILIAVFTYVFAIIQFPIVSTILIVGWLGVFAMFKNQ